MIAHASACRIVFSLLLSGMQPLLAAEVSMCPVRPIRFAHYEAGLMYSSGFGGIDDDFQKELVHRSQCQFEVSVTWT